MTAYDTYAIAAFEEGAIDYVMKPFTLARLAASVQRLKERLHQAPANLDKVLNVLAGCAAEPRQYLRWINAGEGQNVRLITVGEVFYFQADNKNTLVVTAHGQPLINRSIRQPVGELDPEMFWQVHRPTIVNVNVIASVHPT